MNNLSTYELKNKLIAITIGGAKNGVNLREKALLFGEYVKKAFPEFEVIDVIPTNTSAALNSISGEVRLKFPDGSEKKVFAKIHIESNTKSMSSLGAEKEYSNAKVLSDRGWPVLKPLYVSQTTGYPLLLYPVILEDTLFTKVEQSSNDDDFTLTQNELKSLKEYNQEIGKKELLSIRKSTSGEAISSPVQTLFLQRVKKEGRITQWYKESTTFQLPGMKQPVSWIQLLDFRWEINGIPFKNSLRTTIEQARQALSFVGEDTAFLIFSHGDDHAGNVLLTSPTTLIDPAFAGWNPAMLEVKALAHTGFLPMAAMYYLPSDLQVSYQQVGTVLKVENNMEKLPMYKTQEVLAKQIIDSRVLPLLRSIKDQGGSIKKEKMRVQSGLACCALLTINIATLLEQRKGIGLLPLAIMFSELQGLPMLDYLNTKMQQL